MWLWVAGSLLVLAALLLALVFAAASLCDFWPVPCGDYPHEPSRHRWVWAVLRSLVVVALLAVAVVVFRRARRASRGRG